MFGEFVKKKKKNCNPTLGKIHPFSNCALFPVPIKKKKEKGKKEELEKTWSHCQNLDGV